MSATPHILDVTWPSESTLRLPWLSGETGVAFREPATSVYHNTADIVLPARALMSAPAPARAKKNTQSVTFRALPTAQLAMPSPTLPDVDLSSLTPGNLAPGGEVAMGNGVWNLPGARFANAAESTTLGVSTAVYSASPSTGPDACAAACLADPHCRAFSFQKGAAQSDYCLLSAIHPQLLLDGTAPALVRDTKASVGVMYRGLRLLSGMHSSACDCNTLCSLVGDDTSGSLALGTYTSSGVFAARSDLVAGMPYLRLLHAMSNHKIDDVRHNPLIHSDDRTSILRSLPVDTIQGFSSDSVTASRGDWNSWGVKGLSDAAASLYAKSNPSFARNMSETPVPLAPMTVDLDIGLHMQTVPMQAMARAVGEALDQAEATLRGETAAVHDSDATVSTVIGAPQFKFCLCSSDMSTPRVTLPRGMTLQDTLYSCPAQTATPELIEAQLAAGHG